MTFLGVTISSYRNNYKELQKQEEKRKQKLTQLKQNNNYEEQR